MDVTSFGPDAMPDEERRLTCIFDLMKAGAVLHTVKWGDGQNRAILFPADGSTPLMICFTDIEALEEAELIEFYPDAPH